MKLIRKDTDYAVRAIAFLAKNTNRFCSSSEISKNANVPLSYLRRILQTLVKEGFVESKEGIKGGLKLIKSPKEINLANLINIFQGTFELSDCMFRKKICENRAHCPLRKAIKRIEDKITKEVKGITIAKLLGK